MPPARTVIDEDLDDLNDVLADFTSTPIAPTKPVPAAPISTPVSSELETEDFPDPEDDELLDSEAAEFERELQNGMKALMGGLTEEDGLEFNQLMKDMLSGAGGAGDFDAEAMLASLGVGAATPAPSNSKGKSKSVSSPTPAPTGNFQDTIAAAMNKIKETSTNLDQESEEKRALGNDPLAQMMAQMSGLGDLAGAGGEEGLQGMLDEVMQQLMSKELLYEPLKELLEKYPAYLTTNATTLSAADLTRFTAQNAIVAEIVTKFEEPGSETDLEGSQSALERNKKVVELVARMNECGAPPTELMGEMPAGMGEGMPEGCVIA